MRCTYAVVYKASRADSSASREPGGFGPKLSLFPQSESNLFVTNIVIRLLTCREASAPDHGVRTVTSAMYRSKCRSQNSSADWSSCSHKELTRYEKRSDRTAVCAICCIVCGGSIKNTR